MIHHTTGSQTRTLLPLNIYNHEKTLIPVGIPITILTELKNTEVLTSKPTINM